MTAIERRQYILETLSDRRSISVGNLAKECNVSIRTIKYDIESLSSSVPILTVPDPGGGIRVADGRYHSRRYLREDREALLRPQCDCELILNASSISCSMRSF